MKKHILLIITVGFIFCNANSQITKGNWMVGGNGSFSSNKNSSTNYKTTNIQLAPNIGYFVWDKFSTGLKVNYTYQRDSYNGSGINSNSFIVGPFVRYYFLDKEKLVNLFLEGNYDYGIYKSSGIYTISDGKLNKYSFLAGPVIYFNSSVGIEFTVGYYSNKDINAKTTNSGFQMGIGLQVHLTK